MNYHRELDTRGLNCPLPILRTKKMLAEMQSGEVVRVIATDPGSMKDFPAFCRQTGNELLANNEVSSPAGREYEFFLMRK